MKFIIFFLLMLLPLHVIAALPYVNFKKNIQSFSEGQVVVVTAELSGPSSLGVSVKVVPHVSSTADSNDHDMGNFGEILIAPNQREGSFTFILRDDEVVEPNEELVLAMTSPVNATILGDDQLFTVVISDELPIELPVVSFSSSSSVGLEGEVVEVRATLSEPANSLVLVPLISDGTTANQGEDHDFYQGAWIIFFPGQTEALVAVNLYDDGISDSGEKIRMEMIGPVSNARVSDDPAQRSHEITIHDAPSETK